jgi:hypothetical protein
MYYTAQIQNFKEILKLPLYIKPLRFKILNNYQNFPYVFNRLDSNFKSKRLKSNVKPFLRLSGSVVYFTGIHLTLLETQPIDRALFKTTSLSHPSSSLTRSSAIVLYERRVTVHESKSSDLYDGCPWSGW